MAAEAKGLVLIALGVCAFTVSGVAFSQSAPAPTPTQEGAYTVKPGDSLSKIASHYDGVSWREIFEANRDQLDDPDLIQPGQQLRIPSKG